MNCIKISFLILVLVSQLTEDLYSQDNNGVKTEEQLLQAEIHKNQGYKRLEEAKVKLKQNMFSESSEKLQDAGESFRISLSYNDDPLLRENTDREILSLSEEIIRLQTSVVIEKVRKNINRARELYIKEDFPAAENLLITSQTIWKTVNTEDNDEVLYWLNLVKAALFCKIKTGNFRNRSSLQ